MTQEPDEPADSIAPRRLLLAKSLFEHGLGHSRSAGAVNKIIAVHNFHNAIEIVLRAIILSYGIRGAKQLNIDFESMLNEIDSHPEFKEGNRRLPYRSELRSLNQIRNLAQHHAHEPESSSMEEWRVFSRRFLNRDAQEYFDVDFETLDRSSFLVDEDFRNLVALAKIRLAESKWTEAAGIAKLAWRYASIVLSSHAPSGGHNSAFFVNSSIRRENEEQGRVVAKIYERIGDAEQYAALLASGVSPADVSRLESLTVWVHLILNGKPVLDYSKDVAEQDARWAVDFVAEKLFEWQLSGLEMKVPARQQHGCRLFCDDELGAEKPPAV